MSNTEAILLLDCGTGGVKSTLLARGEATERPHFLPPQRIPAELTDGATGKKRVWQPALLLRQVTNALLSESQRAKDARLSIAGVGITSTTSSTVSLEGQHILPMPPPLRWDDQQSQQEAIQIENIRASTKSMPWMDPIMPDSGISKAVWLMSHYPREFTATKTKVVEQWTFLNWFLTESLVQCETILARKWGWTNSLPWPDAFKIGLDTYLRATAFPNVPPLAAYKELERHILSGDVKTAGDRIGPMTWRLARALAIRTQPFVFAVPYDTFAQIIGMGMVEESQDLAITFGTSQGICSVLPVGSLSDSAAVSPIPDSPVRGTSMLFDGIASCGGAVRFVCENYGFITPEGSIDSKRIEKCLDDTQPGSEGIMMLPYYNGGRRVSRCVPVDGKIEGLNQGKLKENIIRALFESIAFITRAILNDFERITGTKYRQIRVSGGPTQNQPFMRILASILGRDVVLFKEVEAGLVGCAVCVAKGLGWYDSLQKTQNALVETSQIIKPDPTQTRMYESLCNQYLRRFANDIGLSPVTEQN